MAIASTPDYAEQLLEDGSLGDDEVFQDVVPHADEAHGVLYVDFDNDWRTRCARLLAEEDDGRDQEVADNLEVLRAFGASAWTDGDTGHGLVRLSLK